MFKLSLALFAFLASAAAQADQLSCLEKNVPMKVEKAVLSLQYDHKEKVATAELDKFGVVSKFSGTFTTDHSVGSTLYTFDLVPAAKLIVSETYNVLPKPCSRGGCDFNDTEDFLGSKFTAELEISGATTYFTCH
jgi:hypothetical protein